jgi:hypothetical protein
MGQHDDAAAGDDDPYCYEEPPSPFKYQTISNTYDHIINYIYICNICMYIFMYMLLNCYYSIIIPMPFLFLLRGSARMASSMDSVGKRCAAMEQGHRDLESHFVDFMPGPPGGRNGDGATAAARGTTWDAIFFWGGGN